jgi:ABC-2 type transport system ATP-binding protein
MNMLQVNTGGIDPQVLLLLAPVLVLVVALELMAIIDLFRADRAVKGGNKVLWLLVILLANPWGALIYFWLGREEQASRDDPAAYSAAPSAPPPEPPAAPKQTVARYEAIRTEGLGKDFGTFRALDSLDLTVRGPGVFGFLGPNGAGKSTTIRMLTGLSRPTRGRAWISGTAVNLETQAAAPLFGYLAEDPQFYGWMTGREFLHYVGQLFGMQGAALARRADELLDLVGLTGAGNRRVGGYSRGMRQRLGIAQALMHNPPVVILDEPVSALDPIGRRDVLALIARLGEEHTVFMSTHILADVERICEQVAVLNQGRLITVARTEELRERYAQPIFEVEFERPAPAFAAGLQDQPWVAGVEQHGTLIRVIAADVQAARTALFPLVAATELPLLRYEQVLPTLEDVFVRLVEDAPAPAGVPDPEPPVAALVGGTKS